MASAKATRATIVHPTDFSAGGALAFAHALAMTLASKSQLCLLQVRDENEAFFSRTLGLRQVRDVLVRWNRLGKEAPYDRWEEELDLRISSMSITARNARTGILEFLDDRPCDLVVLATHEHKALTRWLDVSVQQGVLRKARIASLFLRDGAKGFVDVESGALALKTILIPIDGALDCMVALRQVQAMMKLASCDASVQLLHVGERAPEPTDEQGKPLDLPFIVREGPVVDTILEVADDLKVDLIAMPTAGRHGLLDAVRGSTTARILDDASWPLLALPVG
ncbi:MAG: universal stress protein [Roseiarcus sp.]|jgi:nucleotide-binding universal stress UspA family protein